MCPLRMKNAFTCRLFSVYTFRANTQTAAAKNVEMDAKLAKAMREDSVDQSAVLEELRATKDDSLNHSNHK